MSTVKRITLGAVAGLLALGLGAGAYVHAQDQNTPRPDRPFAAAPAAGPDGRTWRTDGHAADARPRDQLDRCAEGPVKAIADAHKDEWKAIFDRERTAREA
jgi:hypothetical protein